MPTNQPTKRPQCPTKPCHIKERPRKSNFCALPCTAGVVRVTICAKKKNYSLVVVIKFAPVTGVSLRLAERGKKEGGDHLDQVKKGPSFRSISIHFAWRSGNLDELS